MRGAAHNSYTCYPVPCSAHARRRSNILPAHALHHFSTYLTVHFPGVSRLVWRVLYARRAHARTSIPYTRVPCARHPPASLRSRSWVPGSSQHSSLARVVSTGTVFLLTDFLALGRAHCASGVARSSYICACAFPLHTPPLPINAPSVYRPLCSPNVELPRTR